MAIELKVHGLSGVLCSISGRRCWSWSQVKTAIEAATGIPTYEQQIVRGTTDMSKCPYRRIGACIPLKEAQADLTLIRTETAHPEWLKKVMDQPSNLYFAPEDVKADSQVVLAAVRQNGAALEYAAPQLQADADIVLDAVTNNGLALEHASPALQADAKIVLAALRQIGFKSRAQNVFDCVSSELWKNRAFVLSVAQEHEVGLRMASLALRDDRDLVLAIVKRRGLALQAASDNLKRDREVVLAAVRCVGSALRYAATALQADAEIVLEAVSQDGSALQHAADELRADKSVVLAAVKQAPVARHYATVSLQMHPEVLQHSLCGKPTLLQRSRHTAAW